MITVRLHDLTLEWISNSYAITSTQYQIIVGVPYEELNKMGKGDTALHRPTPTNRPYNLRKVGWNNVGKNREVKNT